MSSSTNRREFLQGKSALRAATDALEQLGEAAAMDEASGDSYLTRIGRRAMACEFEVALNTGQYANGSLAAVEALDVVDRLEAQLSVYRPDSEISRLNASAGQEPVKVEARLFELLSLGVRLYYETRGAYELTAGPLSRAWGFFRRAGCVPSAEELADAMARVGTDKIDLNSKQRTIQFRVAGMEINLGSIGKGYALDRAAEIMRAHEVTHFYIHGGQSSVLAHGSRKLLGSAEESPQGGWWIGLRHPLRPHQRMGKVRVFNRALATSGSGVQFFIEQGRRYGHILDPRTGTPAEGSLSTTVIAPTAAEADALSTACYVLGRDGALEYCRSRPEIGMIHISHGAQPGSIDIATSGIASEDLRWDEKL